MMALEDLVPLKDWGDDHRTLYEALDREPMRNPLLAFRRDGAAVVKFGNQRYAFARLRGYTHVATVVLDDVQACKRWLVNYRDEG